MTAWSGQYFQQLSHSMQPPHCRHRCASCTASIGDQVSPVVSPRAARAKWSRMTRSFATSGSRGGPGEAACRNWASSRAAAWRPKWIEAAIEPGATGAPSS